MEKDWTGNKKSTFVTLGASNHTNHDRAEHDFYATEPRAAELLLDEEDFEGSIWENCCGLGHISEVIKNRGYDVVSTDLIERGYGTGGIDFFECEKALADNIITNPPYKYVTEWVLHSLELLDEGKKLALFLPLTFLESGGRREKIFDKTPPIRIYVASNRLLCGMNGDFTEKDKYGNIVFDEKGNPKRMSSAKAYIWAVWEKGKYTDPIIKWIN